jgi:hypothetical protein
MGQCGLGLGAAAALTGAIGAAAVWRQAIGARGIAGALPE